jgi:hypothetical protein
VSEKGSKGEEGETHYKTTDKTIDNNWQLISHIGEKKRSNRLAVVFKDRILSQYWSYWGWTGEEI